MKPLLLLFLALLLKLPATGPPGVRVTFSPLTKATYLQAKKTCVSTKPEVTFPLKETHGRIVIPSSKGPKVFQDEGRDEDDPDQVRYQYLGYLGHFHCHLLKVSYYESVEYWLIDAAGHQLVLGGEPHFAPDMQHIAVAHMGIEYDDGQPNGIQLLELHNGTLRKCWSIEPKTWEPYRICWTSANTLLLSKTMWTGKNPGTAYTYAKLTIN